jgi:hypothetical protein
MKKTLLIFILIAFLYIVIFNLTQKVDKNYILGFGWKVYLKEDERIFVEEKIGVIKEGENIFIKNVKIYPKCSGILSEELKEELLKFDIDKPLNDLIRVVSKQSGDIFLKIEYESKKFDIINYAFGLPIRIDEINLLIPLNFIEINIK